MASAGDSITRGYDATLFGCFLADCPQYSWSTGTSAAVNSHLRRLQALGGTPTAYNDAQTGAKMWQLDGQLLSAAGQGAQYVTVLMGANDLCAATMTSTADFRAQFSKALGDFFASAPPNALVFVSSVPDLNKLYKLFKGNRAVTSTWRNFRICPAMLTTTDPAVRAAVIARETEFNGVLAQVCGVQYVARCRWDGYATYNYGFATTDVSTVDYFHPSVRGQNTLAGLTWAQSLWAKP